MAIMNIQLNGNPHEIEAPMTVTALLESIGFGGKPVVVELDEQALFPRDFPHTQVGEGARVEIVTLAAGG
ncbi:MAG: sulfur carrier protein ThiS [Verrucomicrobiota bacterium]|jgi:thiamine biosynthesis protein ThiS